MSCSLFLQHHCQYRNKQHLALIQQVYDKLNAFEQKAINIFINLFIMN